MKALLCSLESPVLFINRRLGLAVLAVSALACSAQAANLIVDSGYDQNGNPGSSSPFFLTSGTLDRDSGYVCVQNSGVMHHSGGTLNLTGILYLNYAGTFGTTGTYNLSGTGVLNVPTIYIAYGGDGTFNQSGGTNTVTSSLTIGQVNDVGSYNLSGGTLTAPVEYIGDYNAATFTQGGGTNTVNGTLHLGNHAGSGYLSSGTYNLNGGTLQVNGIVRGSESGSITATVNFNGGTLRAGADNSAWIPNGLNIYFKAGGVTIAIQHIDPDRPSFDLSGLAHAVEEAFLERATTLLSGTKEHHHAGRTLGGLGRC